MCLSREDEVCNRRNIVGYTCNIVSSVALCTGKCDERCVICIFMWKSAYISKTIAAALWELDCFLVLRYIRDRSEVEGIQVVPANVRT